MKQYIIGAIIASFFIAPLQAFAQPIGVDQYGGYYQGNEYRLQAVPRFPDRLVTMSAEPGLGEVLFMPKIQAKKLAAQPMVLDTTTVDNAKLDATHCGTAKIFAAGTYTASGLVRVKPVCAATVADANHKGLADERGLYRQLSPGAKIAYHTEGHTDGKIVFTDAPSLEELSGKVIKGETDRTQYLVDGINKRLVQVTDIDLYSMYGPGYQKQTLYFDDAIVYSFPIK